MTERIQQNCFHGSPASPPKYSLCPFIIGRSDKWTMLMFLCFGDILITTYRSLNETQSDNVVTVCYHLSSAHPRVCFSSLSIFCARVCVCVRCCLWWLLNKERAVFGSNLSAPESGTWHMSGCDKWCRVSVISPGMPLRCPKPQSQMVLLN